MVSLAKEVARRAVVVSNPARDLAGLVDSISSARIVMLGEASHGTHEFYQWRQAISELLIAQHGFRALAIEGDWPSCHQVSRFLCDRSSCGLSAQQVLVSGFRRWPPWMWANHEFKGMLEWIKDFNLRQEGEEDEQVKLYGLDVYSLFESIATAVEEIEKLDPVLAENARRHYACYYKDEYRQSDLPEGFQSGAELVFKELTSSRWRSQIQNSNSSSRELQGTIFNATQNARIAKNSECFFRAMGQQQGGSWEVRERHMMETLDEILNREPGSKLIVWAHNTQIGDYRATPMYVVGQKNLGGMAKEKYGQDKVALVGFGTFEGSVAASSKWSGTLEIMPVPPAMEGSYEHALHQANIPGGSFYLMLKDAAASCSSSRNHPLLEWRGNRGIGIVYDPSKERLLNYTPCMLAKRYDAFVFITSTKGLEPLEISSLSPMSKAQGSIPY